MLRKTPNENHNTPIRRCILSGERDESPALIRLALGPDGQVAADIHAKAPGRGAWIGVDAATLQIAQQKGQLKGALSRAFKTGQINVVENLSAKILAGLEKALLDRLGLEARASNLICGADKVDTASRSGKVALLLHAADASEDGMKKRDQSWRVGSDQEGSGKTGIRLPFGRDALSAALGRSNAVHVAILNEKAAIRVMHHLGRWLKFNGCSNSDANQGLDNAENSNQTLLEVNERSGL